MLLEKLLQNDWPQDQILKKNNQDQRSTKDLCKRRPQLLKVVLVHVLLHLLDLVWLPPRSRQTMLRDLVEDG